MPYSKPEFWQCGLLAKMTFSLVVQDCRISLQESRERFETKPWMSLMSYQIRKAWLYKTYSCPKSDSENKTTNKGANLQLSLSYRLIEWTRDLKKTPKQPTKQKHNTTTTVKPSFHKILLIDRTLCQTIFKAGNVNC